MENKIQWKVCKTCQACGELMVEGYVFNQKNYCEECGEEILFGTIPSLKGPVIYWGHKPEKPNRIGEYSNYIANLKFIEVGHDFKGKYRARWEWDVCE